MAGAAPGASSAGPKVRPTKRLLAKRVEDARRHAHPLKTCRLATTDERHECGARSERRVRQRAAVRANLQELGNVDSTRSLRSSRRRLSRRRRNDQTNELAGILVRQRLDQQRMDDAEDGRVGADAERQRQDGHCGKARRPAQHPRGVVQIPPGIIQPAQGAFVAVALLHLLDAAERALRRESGLVGRQAAASKLVFEQLEV